jgi:transcriptional antiterminator NusG
MTLETYSIGERVRVIDGPLATYEAIVETVDEARSQLSVAVTVAGRAVPIAVEGFQIEKLS